MRWKSATAAMPACITRRPSSSCGDCPRRSEGKVHVFTLTDCPDAAAASVWAAWATDGAAIAIHIVLHTAGIATAVDAVRSIYTS